MVALVALKFKRLEELVFLLKKTIANLLEGGAVEARGARPGSAGAVAASQKLVSLCVLGSACGCVFPSR